MFWREIECLRDQRVNNTIITVSHLAKHIINYFGDGSSFGVTIEYFIEETPLDKAGVLYKLRYKLDNDFLLLNVDSIFDIDFTCFVDYHKAKGEHVTLFPHPNSHPYGSGVLIADSDRSVEAWLTKEDVIPEWYRNRVNAGLHVINPTVVDMVDVDAERIGTEEENGKIIKVDLDHQILKPLCVTRKMFCYDSPEYVKDMGTPDRYETICADYREGRVTAKTSRINKGSFFLIKMERSTSMLDSCEILMILSFFPELQMLSGLSCNRRYLPARNCTRRGYLRTVVRNP